eukprot:36725_1
MHWSPLSGVLPLYGMGFMRKAKQTQPKIHIIAKIHTPPRMHNNKVDGYLDYGLLEKLLFDDGHGVVYPGHKRDRQFLKKMETEREDKRDRLERLSWKQLEALYQSYADQDEKDMTTRHARREDDRMDMIMATEHQRRRRRMLNNGDKGRNVVINIITKCKILNHDDNNYEICLKYNTNNNVLNVDIKMVDHKLVR